MRRSAALAAMVARHTSIRAIAELQGLRSEPVYADTAVSAGGEDPTFLYLAHEHPGLFTVTIDAPGYRTWILDDVRVAKDNSGCHVVTTQLKARLQPGG